MALSAYQINLLLELHGNGYHNRYIARRCKCSSDTVNKYLFMNGLKPNPYDPKKGKAVTLEANAVQQAGPVTVTTMSREEMDRIWPTKPETMPRALMARVNEQRRKRRGPTCKC